MQLSYLFWFCLLVINNLPSFKGFINFVMFDFDEFVCKFEIDEVLAIYWKNTEIRQQITHHFLFH